MKTLKRTHRIWLPLLLAIVVASTLAVRWTNSAYDPNSPAYTHNAPTDIAQIRENTNQLRSHEASAAEPANLVAGVLWYDTATGLFKLRNLTNTAWQTMWNVTTGGLPAGAALANIGGGGISSAYLGAGAALGNIGGGGVSEAYLGWAAVSQSKLKTSSGEVCGDGNFTLPGGEYGFYPQIKWVGTGPTTAQIASGGGSTSYTTNIYQSGGAPSCAQQRYVTSSGEVYWIFLLRDRTTKKIIASYSAPDHPCFGNGGKPLGVPHPFGRFDSTKYEIIVINPDDAQLKEIKARCPSGDEAKADRSVLDVILADYQVDEAVQPPWPAIPVTVGLPPGHDWKRDPDDTPVAPVKKQIPKPENIKTAALRLKAK